MGVMCWVVFCLFDLFLSRGYIYFCLKILSENLDSYFFDFLSSSVFVSSLLLLQSFGNLFLFVLVILLLGLLGLVACGLPSTSLVRSSFRFSLLLNI